MFRLVVSVFVVLVLTGSTPVAVAAEEVGPRSGGVWAGQVAAGARCFAHGSPAVQLACAVNATRAARWRAPLGGERRLADSARWTARRKAGLPVGRRVFAGGQVAQVVVGADAAREALEVLMGYPGLRAQLSRGEYRAMAVAVADGRAGDRVFVIRLRVS